MAAKRPYYTRAITTAMGERTREGEIYFSWPVNLKRSRDLREEDPVSIGANTNAKVFRGQLTWVKSSVISGATLRKSFFQNS